VGALVSSACLDRDLTPLTPCTHSAFVESIQQNAVQKVDLLFVIDDSQSMAGEQERLRSQIPRMIRVLTTGDQDGDNAPDFPAVRDLQVGVVSTDMGTGGYTLPSCDNGVVGKDGALLTRGDTSIPGCMATYPSILRFRPEDHPEDRRLAEAEAFAGDVNCVASAGVAGCGLEQPLEAALKAVTPSSCQEPHCTFTMGTRGHADTVNAGFVRPDSLLAIVVLTDEEDCSIADEEFFNSANPLYGRLDNMRCMRHPEATHPVARYVEGLLATRERKDLLVVALIAGIPPALALPSTSGTTFDDVLAELDTFQRLDPACDGSPEAPRDCPRPMPSCRTADGGDAFAPSRLVRVARDLELGGANGIVQSICQDDFTPALDAIIERIGAVLDRVCLPRKLNPDASGLVACRVVEELPAVGDVTTCEAASQLADPACATDPSRCSRIAAGQLPDGRAVCEIVQRPVVGQTLPTAPGWFYDDFTETVQEGCDETRPQRIGFTAGSEPVNGAQIRLECLQPVPSSAGPSTLDIASPCRAPGETCPTGSSPASDPGNVCVDALFCDAVTHTWQRACGTNADCRPGWQCDPGREGGSICRNPTCG
jgi:hypothetical protein